MIGAYQARSNVKVVFDNPSELYPQARLMYKVKGFIFSKWVEVNSCSQTDHRYNSRTVNEMVAILLDKGHRGRWAKQKARKLKYQLKNS